MTAPHATQIVDGYLARLEAELADVPAARRSELLNDVRAHIAEARAALSEESDAGLLNIVERLGDPAVVAAETRERVGVPAFRPGLQEIGGLALLALPLPWLWLIGAALVWWSNAWTQREKLIGTTAPLVPLVPFVASRSLRLGGLGHWWLVLFWAPPAGGSLSGEPSMAAMILWRCPERPDPCYDRPGVLALTCRSSRCNVARRARQPGGQ